MHGLLHLQSCQRDLVHPTKLQGKDGRKGCSGYPLLSSRQDWSLITALIAWGYLRHRMGRLVHPRFDWALDRPYIETNPHVQSAHRIERGRERLSAPLTLHHRGFPHELDHLSLIESHGRAMAQAPWNE